MPVDQRADAAPIAIIERQIYSRIPTERSQLDGYIFLTLHRAQRQAWDLEEADKAKRLLRNLARWPEQEASGADGHDDDPRAASIGDVPQGSKVPGKCQPPLEAASPSAPPK